MNLDEYSAPVEDVAHTDTIAARSPGAHTAALVASCWLLGPLDDDGLRFDVCIAIHPDHTDRSGCG